MEGIVRMKRELRKKIIIVSIKVLTVFLIHFILIHYHAERDTVAHLFAAGEHLSLATKLSAVFFMMIRLLAIVCIPAIILEEIGRAVVDGVRGRAT